jgi:hypothetical protein
VLEVRFRVEDRPNVREGCECLSYQVHGCLPA